MPEAIAAPTTEPAATNWSAIAAEAFGSEFHGEVKKTEPAPAAEPAEPVQADPNLAAPADPATTGDPAVTPEEKTISSILELAEHLETDPEWIHTLEAPVKINGVEGKATLGDLIKSYQIQSAAEQRLAEAKENAKAITQAAAKQREQLTGEFAKVAGLIEQAEKLILADESKVDWTKLRDSDPAEWTAKRTEFAERRAQVNALKQSAVQSYQTVTQASASEVAEQTQQYLQQQHELLIGKLPEWKDAEVAAKDKQEIAAFLLSRGFSKEDLSAATDHRMILMARDAMLFAKGQNKAAIAAKKIPTIPKVLKPGAPKSPAQINAANIAALEAKAKKSGSIEDAVALLQAKRGNK